MPLEVLRFRAWYSHPKVLQAIRDQIDAIPFAHTGFFTSKPAEDLADKLIETAPGGLEKVYYVSGGSEAVEAALKMARQYYLEIGQPQRRHLITRRQSYHGNTLGALAAGGNSWRREPFEPLLIGCTILHLVLNTVKNVRMRANKNTVSASRTNWKRKYLISVKIASWRLLRNLLSVRRRVR